MKIEELIVEELTDDEILEILESDCRPFLESCGNRFLYRGSKTNENEPTLKKIKPRLDRVPRDMDANLHVMIDNYFEKKFGVRYRSEGVFGTGSIYNAEDYGTVFAMFPIGEFSFISSPRIVDLYSNIKMNETFKNMFKTPFDKNKFQHNQETINEYLQSKNYSSDNLAAALHKGNEIMIKCNEYYIIPLSTIKKIKFKKYVKNMWDKITK